MLLTVLAVNLLVDWLRDHLDPKLRQLGGAAAPESPAVEPAEQAVADAPARGAAAADVSRRG